MLSVVAVRFRCSMCERIDVRAPIDPSDPLNPGKVPDGWRSFADRGPGVRRNRHWCPDCVEFVRGHEAMMVDLRRKQVAEKLRRD